MGAGLFLFPAFIGSAVETGKFKCLIHIDDGGDLVEWFTDYRPAIGEAFLFDAETILRVLDVLHVRTTECDSIFVCTEVNAFADLGPDQISALKI